MAKGIEHGLKRDERAGETSEAGIFSRQLA